MPSIARLAETWSWLNARVMPWVSLASGVAFAVLWREGVDGVRAAFVLASLFGAVTLLVVAPPWRRGAGGGVATWLGEAAWWATVGLAQNAIWFVLPFVVLATTWPSRNAPWTLLLVALAVISCFDLVLREHLLRRPALTAAFVGPVALTTLQLFLPVLTGVPPRHTAWAAGALAGPAVVLLVVRRGRPVTMVAATLGAAAVGAVVGRLALPLLAPAPMRLVSATFALGRDGLDPVAPVAALPAGRDEPAYVFVAVEAPRGLHETVHLVIGDAASRPLAVEGGRAGGYRLWGPVPVPADGTVETKVLTEGGQLVGRVAAGVGPPAPDPSAPEAPSAAAP
ncbi:MAG: hypothetical protein KIT14_19530 [bacterium]|nr:hypothetical protein [bacterium]